MRKWVWLWVSIRLIEAFLREFRLWWAAVWLVGIGWKHAVGAKDFEWFIFCFKKVCRISYSMFTPQKPSVVHFLVSKVYQLKIYSRFCFPGSQFLCPVSKFSKSPMMLSSSWQFKTVPHAVHVYQVQSSSLIEPLGIPPWVSISES